MANPPKPWKAEYAKSSRSSCKTCKSPIEKEVLRLGKMVQATQFDGFMPMWNHASCVLRKAKQIKSADDVEGLELLRWEDQQKIRKYVDGAAAVVSSSSASANVECGVEVSQTSRATCRICSQKIMKEEIRISTKPEGQGARSLSWNHAKCYMETASNPQLEKFSGWGSLSDSERATLKSLVKKNPSTPKVTHVSASGTKAEHQETGQSTSKGGSKRKKALGSEQKVKVAKAGEDSASNKVSSSRNPNDLKDDHSKASVVENQLEMQSRALWALKDDLKKHVTTSEALSSGTSMSTDEASTGGGSQGVNFNHFAFLGDSGPGEGSGRGQGKGKVPTAADEREARIRSCANFDAWSADPTGEQKRRDEMKACVDEIKAMAIPYSLKMKGFKAVLKTSVRHLWMAFDDEDKLQFLLSLD